MSRPLDDDFDYKAEVKKCKTIDDVMGKNGLIQVWDITWKDIKRF